MADEKQRSILITVDNVPFPMIVDLLRFLDPATLTRLRELSRAGKKIIEGNQESVDNIRLEFLKDLIVERAQKRYETVLKRRDEISREIKDYFEKRKGSELSPERRREVLHMLSNTQDEFVAEKRFWEAPYNISEAQAASISKDTSLFNLALADNNNKSKLEEVARLKFGLKILLSYQTLAKAILFSRDGQELISKAKGPTIFHRLLVVLLCKIINDEAGQPDSNVSLTDEEERMREAIIDEGIEL